MGLELPSPLNGRQRIRQPTNLAPLPIPYGGERATKEEAESKFTVEGGNTRSNRFFFFLGLGLAAENLAYCFLLNTSTRKELGSKQ